MADIQPVFSITSKVNFYTACELMQRLALRLFAAFLLAAAGGCQTHATRLRDAREAFYTGDLARAALLLDETTYRDRERDCVQLDEAFVKLLAGRPVEAEQQLRQVRDRFDHLEQQDLGEAGMSLLTDDMARAYRGEDYEQILLRAVLAIANLMHDGGDAAAYCLQLDAKQQQIIERGLAGAEGNPKLAYQQVALGAYLHGTLAEQTHLNYDDAQRSFAKVVSWQPTFASAHTDLQRASRGVHSAHGNGVVYVFALIGRGPYKEETIAEATSDALFVADRILSAVGDHSLPPTIAPVKIPEVVMPLNRITGLQVHVGGRWRGTTQIVTDVAQLAVGQYEAVRDHLIARAVVRRIVKKAAIYSTKDALNVDDSLASFALNAAGVIWEATESADTRCWGLLPQSIQVLRLELPVGNHTLQLQPTASSGPFGAAASSTIEVTDGRNTYVLACFPDDRLVGQILTSR